MRLRMPDRVSAMKIGIAAMLTWMIFGGYILANILGVHLSPPVLALLVMSSFLVFYLVVDRIHRSIEDLYDLDIDEFYTMGDDVVDSDDSTFLVWMLVDRMVSMMTSGRKPQVSIVALSFGFPLAAYPAKGVEYDADLSKKLESMQEDIIAHTSSTGIIVVLSHYAYGMLKKLVEDNDGESIQIRNSKELALIYSLAYALANELARGADDAIKHYMAFKTLVKLAKTGGIIVPEKLLYNAIPIDTDTRKKIIQQLKEEKLI